MSPSFSDTHGKCKELSRTVVKSYRYGNQALMKAGQCGGGKAVSGMITHWETVLGCMDLLWSP